MVNIKTIAFGGLLLALAGCGGFETNYSNGVSSQVSKNWRMSAVSVDVPRSLTVSEQNSYAPDADIVWREDPFGDRHAQVDKIVTTAMRRGTSSMRSGKPVQLRVQVREFHALSELARRGLNQSGIHNITLVAQINDARTGQILAGPELIRADLVAFVGEEALAAEREGQTQKVRITDHLSRVIAGWLGRGPDARSGPIDRIGR